MAVTEVFETDEERFLNILKVINMGDYHVICLISVSPFLLDLYAKRFEDLQKQRKLPSRLEYAEVRYLIDRKKCSSL